MVPGAILDSPNPKYVAIMRADFLFMAVIPVLQLFIPGKPRYGRNSTL